MKLSLIGELSPFAYMHLRTKVTPIRGLQGYDNVQSGRQVLLEFNAFAAYPEDLDSRQYIP
jgi:hypothetical protein